MVNIEGGRWMIGLGVYFFMIYVSIFLLLSLSSTAPELGIDTEGIYATDPGFQTETSPFTDKSYCTGLLSFSARHCYGTNAYDNVSCNSLNGCTWSDTLGLCVGVLNVAAYPGVWADYNCPPELNETMCKMVNCHWISITSQSSDDYRNDDGSIDFDFGALKRTFGVMTGFSAGLGIPSEYMWIVSFFAFWLPLIMFLIALYSLTPLI